MSDAESRPRPVFSKTLRPNGKLYYLDVYPGKSGTPYLSICENRKNKTGGFDRIRLFLAPEAVPEMREALDEVHTFLESYQPANKDEGAA